FPLLARAWRRWLLVRGQRSTRRRCSTADRTQTAWLRQSAGRARTSPEQPSPPCPPASLLSYWPIPCRTQPYRSRASASDQSCSQTQNPTSAGRPKHIREIADQARCGHACSRGGSSLIGPGRENCTPCSASHDPVATLPRTPDWSSALHLAPGECSSCSL